MPLVLLIYISIQRQKRLEENAGSLILKNMETGSSGLHPTQNTNTSTKENNIPVGQAVYRQSMEMQKSNILSPSIGNIEQAVIITLNNVEYGN